MSVSYKWKNETGQFREINILNSAIRVADLKVLIAERSGLKHEFARKIDIQLIKSEPKSESTKSAGYPIYYDDEELIEPFTQVVAVRGSWKSHQDIKHQAKTELTNDEWKPKNINEEHIQRKERKQQVPSEYLCSMCGLPMIEPIIIKCVTHCGSNACRKCMKKAEDDLCPTCGKKITGFIQNLALERLLEKTNWDSFDVTNRPLENASIEESQKSPSLPSSDTHSLKPWKKFSSNTEESNSEMIYYVIELTMNNLSLVRNNNFILLEKGSIIYKQILDSSIPSDGVSIMVCAQAGGGTSYAIGGSFLLSLADKLDYPIQIPDGMIIDKKWQRFRNPAQNISNESEHIFRVNWIEKFDTMPMLPLRKQPLWGLLNPASKNTRNNSKSIKNERLDTNEVVMNLNNFESLKLCIQRYAKFGSRPGEALRANKSDPNIQLSITNFVPPEKTTKTHKNLTRRNLDVQNHEISSDGSYEIHSLNFPQGPKPYPLSGMDAHLNPYIGYCSFLPFLSREQFENIKKIQKMAKFFVKRRDFPSELSSDPKKFKRLRLTEGTIENYSLMSRSSSTEEYDNKSESSDFDNVSLTNFSNPEQAPNDFKV